MTDKICTWTEDSEGDWDTACGNMFIIITGTPQENRMEYCPYCGRELKENPK